MAQLLILAQGRQHALAAKPLESLMRLPGYGGSEVFRVAPGADEHRQAVQWPQIALHRVRDDAAEEAASILLAGDPQLRAGGALTRWTELSTHVSQSRAEHGCAPSGRAIFAVLARPKAGRDDEYDTWYRRHHVPDMFAVPGFIQCDRFRFAGPEAEMMWQFLTIYEMRTEDVRASVAAEVRHIANPRIVWTDAKDSSTTRVMIYLPERLQAPADQTPVSPDARTPH